MRYSGANSITFLSRSSRKDNEKEPDTHDDLSIAVASALRPSALIELIRKTASSTDDQKLSSSTTTKVNPLNMLEGIRSSCILCVSPFSENEKTSKNPDVSYLSSTQSFFDPDVLMM